MNTPFEPACGLANPHVQTIASAYFNGAADLPRRRERLETPDGDFLDIDWAGEGTGPVVILLHGLAGTANSVYIRSLQKTLVARGLAVAALNFRGCSGVPNRLARCYHSGETQDIDYVFRCLRSRYPQGQMGVVGFSLGGSVVLKWLGEMHPPLQAAVAVSVPFLLARCADYMDVGFSRIYRNRLLAHLKTYLAEKLSYLEKTGNQSEAQKLRDLGDLSGVKSFWDFDGRVIAPLFGFTSALDYYARCSSRQFLARIVAPTLIIHAEDDPFVPADAIPTKDELSSAIALDLSPHGGHVGFIAKPRFGNPRYWLDERISAYLSAQFQSSRSGDA